ncbi:MAG: hypothetical protein V3V84_00690 [Candidatus Bathyarchaeia archaeon]
MAYNNEFLTSWPSGQNKKAPTAFLYTTTDTLATVIVSGYFNGEVFRFKTGTLLYVQTEFDTNDVVALLKVTKTGSVITTEVFAPEGSGAKIIGAGLFTTAGGDVTETITVTGALVTDTALVTINTVGAAPRTITSAIGATDAITVTLGGDPSTDHVLNYAVIRAI